MHPLLLRIGPLTLYSYGAMIALGFLAAAGVASRRARRIGMDPAQIQNVAWVALLSGILGARAAYIALNWPIYRGDWTEIFRLDHGGLVFYGGFAAGLAAAAWKIRRTWLRQGEAAPGASAHRLPFWPTVDLLVPPLVLAHAFGRVGCFLNGCCYGKPTSVPWAVAFPGEGIPRHPVQLYETAFLSILFLALKKMEAAQDQSGQRPGTILFTYGAAYGVWRFTVEFLRGDNPIVLAGLTVFQLASLALVLVSGVALLGPLRPSTRRSP